MTERNFIIDQNTNLTETRLETYSNESDFERVGQEVFQEHSNYFTPTLDKIKSVKEPSIDLLAGPIYSFYSEKFGVGLSLGQQQRLCIARVVAVRPEVILMDESTSAVDPIATLRIEQLIAELKKDYTIVIGTHNMQQAARVSEYTGLFWLGELVEFSPTDLIFTRPKQELTEAYITGKMG